MPDAQGSMRRLLPTSGTFRLLTGHRVLSSALADDRCLVPRGVAPKLANIQIGKIPPVPKLSDIWHRNSELTNKSDRSAAGPAHVGGELPLVVA
ncbi:hypothetical protein BJY16_007500 [Actinoplanes octamycinicus]|uniref:Uncharacterized protein n=1 Tax=Actinoplanes octamycinicus TaxID=135948 RepID=A0A7W7H4W8_9ACTN|nr:hypothetical protein [Actinoplanes octamycinicus]